MRMINQLGKPLFMTFCGAVVFTLLLNGCGRPNMGTTDCFGEDCYSEEDGAAVDAQCTEDIDCAGNQVCEAGNCVLPAETPVQSCEGNNDCPMGMFCNLGTSSCVDCLSDDHCDLGLSCLEDGSCGDPSIDPDVPGGDTGAGSSCEEAADCPVGYDCVDGQCAPTQNQGIACSEQSDCDVYGRVCVSGQCEPCSASVACPGTLECSAGICIDPNDTPTGGGGTGGLDGLGGLGGDICTSYADCPNLQACDMMNFSCFACTSDTDCNGIFDMLMAGPASCCTAAMAASGQCNAGSCVPQ